MDGQVYFILVVKHIFLLEGFYSKDFTQIPGKFVGGESCLESTETKIKV